MNKEKLQEYFYSNVATMFWSVFLLLGGGIFVAYFAHIEYMPDFDLKSSITITAAAAATALIITVSLLVIMIFPGVFWRYVWGENSRFKNDWNDSEERFFSFGMFIWLIIPIGVAGVSILSSHYIGFKSTFIVVVALLFYFFYFVYSRKLTFIHALQEVLLLSVSAFVSSFMLFFALLFVLKLTFGEGVSRGLPLLFSGALSSSFIIYANLMATKKPKKLKSFYWFFLIGAFIFIVVFSSFGKFHRIPVRVMEIYKFGNVFVDDVVLKEDACKVFRALKIDVSDSIDEICTAEGVLILSRLGKEVYMQHSSEEGEVKFTIPSDQIISWSIRDKRESRVTQHDSNICEAEC